ncbi:tyrosine-type recombinase/integrase [Marinobacter sp. Hex_13]|uniref:tyrosine-type recombinase/integrase n=1 Tax=Marinobacter sp. Hex_13 TaxID=1795866 RepID=UPI00079BEA94|nr:tyrosine-type recombinase/integrase [Marinobacter sp. Hex_13]KXJ45836.1 MAG: hypothetical protein AXW11_12145 [Marinobacter sp. Hex_13]
MANGLPKRWAFKFGAYYYRPHPSEKDLFDGKSWYRLGDTYPKALRKFASIKEIEAGEVLASAVDRYTVEVLPTLKPQTQASYSAALKRIRQGLGHNKVVMIKPQLVYQYMDNVSRARSMNLANTDLKVLNQVLRHCVRWGVIEQNQITGEVKYFGKRDGLKKERDRYVQDWELAAWLSVAKPQQVAFAALVLLIGTRKADTLRIMEAHIGKDALHVQDSKTGKDDPFEMTEALREAIDQARAAKPKPSLYLFPNSNGGCYVGANGRCESFDRAWRGSIAKAIKETDLEVPFTRHDLRAKAGSDAENEARAQELLRHSDPAMTRKHYRRKKQMIRPAK